MRWRILAQVLYLARLPISPIPPRQIVIIPFGAASFDLALARFCVIALVTEIVTTIGGIRIIARDRLTTFGTTGVPLAIALVTVVITVIGRIALVIIGTIAESFTTECIVAAILTEIVIRANLATVRALVSVSGYRQYSAYVRRQILSVRYSRLSVAQ